MRLLLLLLLLLAAAVLSLVTHSRADLCVADATCWGLNQRELASAVRASPFPALYRELLASEAACAPQPARAACEAQGARASGRCRWHPGTGCAAWNSVASFQLQARACAKSPGGAVGSLDLEAVAAAECQGLPTPQDCQAAMEGACVWTATTAAPEGACALRSWSVLELEDRLAIGSCAVIPSAEVAFSQYIGLTGKCAALASSQACQKHGRCAWREAQGRCTPSLSVLAGPLAPVGIHLAKDIRACEQRPCQPPPQLALQEVSVASATSQATRPARMATALLLSAAAGLMAVVLAL